jgi:DNA-directed RNA polymerase alpha subunit
MNNVAAFLPLTGLYRAGVIDTRAYRVLREAGIRDLKELTRYTRGELLSVPNMWASTAVTVERALARYDLKLDSGNRSPRRSRPVG